MALCEHRERYNTPSSTTPSDPLSPKLIQDELIWGLSYRNNKRKEREYSAIPPKKPPVDVPFKVCRERQRKRKRKASKSEKEDKTKQKSRKLSLLERSVLSQSKYMQQLSIPNPNYQEPPPKKRKQKCEIEPCPPRLVQLAVPMKRRVLANWKEYQTVLPTEMLVRYQKLLHTDKNLEPRDARYHYKKLDKVKKKRLRIKRRLLKKKREEKLKGDQKWLKENIEITTKVILDYVKDSPAFGLNYKQLLLSDEILNRLEHGKMLKKPSRSSKNYFKKTIILVSDKLALWIDTLTKFVDIQAVESEEDIPPLTISSLGESEAEISSEVSVSGESEDEGEDEEEDESEDGRANAEELLWHVGKIGGPEDQMTDVNITDDENEAEAFSDLLNDTDNDILEKLIHILENSTDEFLDSPVDEEKFPGVKHRNILDRMKVLKEEIVLEKKKTFLESVLIDWAMQNDPGEVNNAVLGKIHDTAALINEWLCSKMRKGDDADTDFEELGGESEEGEDYYKGLVDTGEGEFEGEDIGGLEDEYGGEEEGLRGDYEEAEGFEEGEGLGEEEGLKGDYEEAEGFEEGEDLGGFEALGEGEDLGEFEALGEGEDLGEFGALGEEEEEDFGAFEALDEAEDLGEFEALGEEDSYQGEQFGEEFETKKEDAMKEAPEFDFSERERSDAGEVSHPPTLLNYDDISELQTSAVATSGEAAEGEVTEGSEIPEAEIASEEELGKGVAEPAKDEEEAKKEVDVIYEPGKQELGGVIKGHKAKFVMEHSPSTVCCLSLKIWAVWLLEITHNAHNWTKWVQGVIKKVREFAATIRGDVTLPDGKKKVLYKSDWRQFVEDTELKIIAWRQYGAHVKELSSTIVDNFHGKRVNCCPKCLQDHLIKNVVTAHETLQALTEAMNCAGYWHRCLDDIVEKTLALADFENADEVPTPSESEESGDVVDLEELRPCICQKLQEQEESGESIYEIEELEINPNPMSSFVPRRPR